ncbi:MAG: hypothetical protein DHS20C21_16940 [Gemmatimonadota bacterium]|nr:MAG: hypothetical protein DHS20C21_16940 [Gemmatimonadota bacterium]
MSRRLRRSAVALLLVGSVLALNAHSQDVNPDAVGGALSFGCRAGLWALGVPGALLVGAGLMWMYC